MLFERVGLAAVGAGFFQVVHPFYDTTEWGLKALSLRKPPPLWTGVTSRTRRQAPGCARHAPSERRLLRQVRACRVHVPLGSPPPWEHVGLKLPAVFYSLDGFFKRHVPVLLFALDYLVRLDIHEVCHLSHLFLFERVTLLYLAVLPDE